MLSGLVSESLDSGMPSEVFGDQTRIAVQLAYYSDRVIPPQPYYKTGQYMGGRPEFTFTISEGDLDLHSNRNVLRLMVLDWTNRPELREELRSALTLTPNPIASDK